MGPSDVDHIFYSTVGFEELIAKFERRLQTLWPEMASNSDLSKEPKPGEERRERLYSRNAHTLAAYDLSGFPEEHEGEGDVFLIAVKRTVWMLNGKVSDSRNPTNPEDFPLSNDGILLQHAWQYSLVLPEYESEGVFSGKVYRMFWESLQEAAEER